MSLFFNISFTSCPAILFSWSFFLLLIGCYKVCKVLKYTTRGFQIGEPGSGDNLSYDINNAYAQQLNSDFYPLRPPENLKNITDGLLFSPPLEGHYSHSCSNLEGSLLFEFCHAIVINVGQYSAGKSVLNPRATVREGIFFF